MKIKKILAESLELCGQNQLTTNLSHFSYFTQKIKLTCHVRQFEIVHMTCQTMFSGKTTSKKIF